MEERLKKFKANPKLIHTKDGAVELFCSSCDFYKDSDKDLECGAFKLLRKLINNGTLTIDEIADAIREK